MAERHFGVCLDILSKGGIELNTGRGIGSTYGFRDYKVVKQPEYRRVLKYNHLGKLLEIAFDPGDTVDLRKLPQDETIPSDGELVILFNDHGITPTVQEDIIPA